VTRFEIRRGAERARTRTDWLDSAHSFAFGSYYDPANLGFSALQACNEDVLQPGPGYPVHAHRDVEILTWVLAGSLTHLAEGGEPTVVPARNLHYVSAGSGLRHTEFSTSPDRPVHLVQMWLRPDTAGTPPHSARLLVGERLTPGRLVLLASGLADRSQKSEEVLRIRQQAALSVARLPAGETVPLPAAPLVHVFVTRGTVTVGGPAGERVELAAGDALRLTGASETGAETITGTAGQPAELLVWQLPDDAAAAPPG
jgi:redox-sensitive bicupin YhaK (pirin superfamily)